MNHLEKLQIKGQYKIAFMPIKPIFAQRIISGIKLFEFRRTALKEIVSHIIIYSSFPEKKIVAIAEVEAVHSASPSAIWEQTKHAAGISRSLYRKYFKGAKKAHAIQIKNVFPLSRPFHPDDIKNGFNVPQSFSYVDRLFLDKILAAGMNPDEKKKSVKIIFVGGIHGVGKSTICAQACFKNGFIHLIASDLIQKFDSESLLQKKSDKKVANVQENQDKLLAGLQISIQEGCRYLLDGHFCLFGSGREILNIPIAIFKQINPHELVVLTDSPSAIQKRLKARDSKNYYQHILQQMQDREIKHAENVGKALNIPTHFIQMKDMNRFYSILSE